MNAVQLKREREAFRSALLTAALALRDHSLSRMDIAVFIERVLAKHAPQTEERNSNAPQ